MALRNPCFKDQIGLICEGGKKTVRRERERKEEEEEEEDGGAKIKPTRYGTTNLVYELYYESHGFCMGF